MQKGQHCEWPSMQRSKGTEEQTALSTEALMQSPLFPVVQAIFPTSGQTSPEFKYSSTQNLLAFHRRPKVACYSLSQNERV